MGPIGVNPRLHRVPTPESPCNNVSKVGLTDPLRRQHNLVPNGIAFLYGWQLKHEVHKGFWLGVEGFGSADIFGARGPERHRITTSYGRGDCGAVATRRI